MLFKPTHVIVAIDTKGEHLAIPVMLDNGPAYTQVEWEATVPADWELNGGEWLFQGGYPNHLREYQVVPLLDATKPSSEATTLNLALAKALRVSIEAATDKTWGHMAPVLGVSRQNLHQALVNGYSASWVQERLERFNEYQREHDGKLVNITVHLEHDRTCVSYTVLDRDGVVRGWDTISVPS